MAVVNPMATIKIVNDSSGRQTDVLIPLETWQQLLDTWQKTVELLENQEDVAVFKEWLENKKTGLARMTTLDDFERELTTDGLLPR